jgi:hypothetical protein
MRLSALILCLLPATFAGAAENGSNGHKLPANEWVKLEEGGVGVRSGAALLYCPAVKRFLIAMGQQTRYDRKPTPPYSEMTFNMEKRRWENALPKGGESWGKLTGPVKAPTFRYGSGLRKGKDGILRPDLRGGYGTQVYHLFACDTDRKRVLYGLNMEYDPAARSWRKLEVKGHPGTPKLPPFELKKPTGPAWSQMCYDPVNREFLLFGGTKVRTESAAPGTWAFDPAKSEWRKLSFGNKEMNKLAATAKALQERAHAAVTACRNRYYRTELAGNAGMKLPELISGIMKEEDIQNLLDEVVGAGKSAKGHAGQQLTWAGNELKAALEGYRRLVAAVGASVDAKAIAVATKVREDLRRAATSLSPEPPPRCFSPMAFDAESKKIVVFGGSGLSHAKSDTWLYDPKTRSWEQRRPAVSPSPRLAHGLVYLPKAKRVALVGGWVGQPGVGCGGFRGSALPPEVWIYDVKGNEWTLVRRWEKPKGRGAEHPAFPRPGNAPQFFAADDGDTILTLAPSRKGPSTWACRVDVAASDSAGTTKHGVGPGTEHYPGGYCSPEWYDKAPPPDAKRTEAELKSLPVNKWVRRSEGGVKRPTFAYCSIAYDPDRDQILTFTGGHGTWHGADVGRYSLATDRWHTDHYAHIPLTFGYFATGGSWGYDFRPWMGVHTWGGYNCDTVTKKLVILTSMPGFSFTYDSELGRFERPWSKLPPGGSSWTCKATPTPKGIVAWTGGRKAPTALWRLDPEKKAWVQFAVKGKLAKPDIDRSGLTWDSKRRKLMILPKKLEGDVLVYDPETGALERRTAKGKKNAPGNYRDCRYVASQDLIFEMMGSAYIIEKNEWVKLPVDIAELAKGRRKKKGQSSRPAAASNSQGLVYDAKRDLLWAVNGYGNKGVFVLKLDAAKARK